MKKAKAFKNSDVCSALPKKKLQGTGVSDSTQRAQPAWPKK
jgi:hypothetical protein